MHDDELTLSTDPDRMDVDVIHTFLATESYWAQGIPHETVVRAIAGSLCFGIFDGARQVAFARVITDSATFAYLCDVFVIREYRGRRLGHRLMEAIDRTPVCRACGASTWSRATRTPCTPATASPPRRGRRATWNACAPTSTPPPPARRDDRPARHLPA